MPTVQDLDQLAIDTLRTLAVDAVQAADSGHPGTPLGAAPAAYALWRDVLTYDPADPEWFNRDRFVLSAGHASMLLYGLLHLADVQDAAEGGPAVSLDDIKEFRQLHGRCPGHPEFGETSGVETTTGPLGQGLATSVGMAVAQRWLAARYNRPGFDLVDFHVYALAGDGCMMEGVASEAASLAGHLGLGNLCWIYDRNHITIEGSTDLAFTEDVGARFQAYGWRVLTVTDGNDLQRLRETLARAKDGADRPTLIISHSHIGYGSPHKQDTASAHGEPLGEEELRATKEALGWDPGARFLVPDGVREHFAAGLGRRGAAARAAWLERLDAYRSEFPALGMELDLIRQGRLPEGWDADLPVYAADAKGKATRAVSGEVLNALAPRVPWLVGGSADLAPSNKTHLKGEDAFQADSHQGRNLHFGVREHAMAAAANGMALTGLRPFLASFLVFTDYARPAMRLAALMGLPVTMVWTHDSIWVGEDGPTHQPVEHLASLRAMPGMLVFRPADANETVEAYRYVLGHPERPACLALSRQNLPVLDRAALGAASGTARGGYVLADAPGGEPQVLLLATGSEVSLCLEAREMLAADGVAARVVSLPSWELFQEQDAAYRESVLPGSVTARVAVEAAAAFGWERFTGLTGAVVAMRSFGASAPGAVVAEHFGFTAEAVAAAARAQLNG